MSRHVRTVAYSPQKRNQATLPCDEINNSASSSRASRCAVTTNPWVTERLQS